MVPLQCQELGNEHGRKGRMDNRHLSQWVDYTWDFTEKSAMSDHNDSLNMVIRHEII